jgi:hypothetical protein
MHDFFPRIFSHSTAFIRLFTHDVRKSAAAGPDIGLENQISQSGLLQQAHGL